MTLLKKYLRAIALVFTFLGCKSSLPIGENQKDNFSKGGDISWVPQMEATGYKFLNENGQEEDILKILKDHGMNTVRLRTWVNPSGDPQSGHCSAGETVAMAIRCKQAGLRIMINFHYSDSWADPGKQNKPAKWKDLPFNLLKDSLHNYTADVMTKLKQAGITPEWVQVGNEIPGGLLWPEGSTDNWSQLAQLLNAGYEGVKKVSPQSKVILHVDKGNDNNRFRWWFDSATAYKVKYDVIGMSYYPYWQEGKPDYTLSINDLGKNLNDMVTRYNKEVMVVEVGGIDTAVNNTYEMLMAVIQKTRAVPNGKGLGVLYWEPQGARSWSKYPLSAWGSDGRPTKALKAFLEK